MNRLEIRSLTNAIKNEAYSIGFQLVGVTSPAPPPHLKTFQTWLRKGHHADMDWISTARARQRRADPLKILPACKSILVIGIRYLKPTPEKKDNAKNARVATYTLGEDYHDVLPGRLSKIVSFIQEKTGEEIANRYYTDTGPILERDLAQRAGLGWIGKNSCLINPKSGSYYLLAEIFLGIQLEYDPPFENDFCGTCTRCIEHCPTGCINPDRTIDANRCISYLTIEHRGFIPYELRSLIGNWLFGCDICQIVCPWNQKFADTNVDPSFNPRPDIPPADLLKELSLTSEEFNRKFRGNPVKRTKRRGYLRNIAIVLGNIGERNAITALVTALKDGEELVRGHSAWALGQLGGVKAREALYQSLKEESHPKVKEEIGRALNQINNPKIV